MKENYHRARDEKNAYVEKIMLQEGTIAEQGQKVKIIIFSGLKCSGNPVVTI